MHLYKNTHSCHNYRMHAHFRSPQSVTEGVQIVRVCIYIIYLHTYVHTYTHIHTHVHTYVHVYIQIMHAHLRIAAIHNRRLVIRVQNALELHGKVYTPPMLEHVRSYVWLPQTVYGDQETQYVGQYARQMWLERCCVGLL